MTKYGPVVKLPSASMKVARKSGTPTPWPIQPRSVRKEYTASAALAFIGIADLPESISQLEV